ncbi:MAG TPA: hypothetical protein VE961_10970, partial [Pyrinomonadaceae bacterium]|nr:hypothetical protein [Pyrinomonadaceae bacterium]
MLRKISASLSLISLLVVSLAPAALATPLTAAAPPQVEKKSAPEFANTNGSTASVRALIKTKGAPTAAHDAALAHSHGRKRATYDALDVVVADLPLNEIASIAARDDVLYVAPDRPVKAQMNLTNDTVGASQVQAGTTTAPGFDGKGIGIAILDTGISASHPDFLRNGKS